MSSVMLPGWYEDPWHGPGMRWWDGHQWTVHTVVPHGTTGPPPAVPAPRRPVPTAGAPPWWTWVIAAVSVVVPVVAFVAVASTTTYRNNGFRYSFPPTATSPVAPPAGTSPATSYQPPHTLRAGPAPPGQPLAIHTRNGLIRVAVIEVVDPVGRGSYYRGPRAATRWVGVRLRVRNAGAGDYIDDVSNDTRLIAGNRTLQSDSALLNTCDVFPVEVTIPPGEARDGCVLFEVPNGAQPRQLRFAADSYFGPELGTFTLGR
jgi:hypothetical protein